MYVCICNAITDKEIRRAADRGASNLYELQAQLGVATGCGSCAAQATEILNDAQDRGRVAQPSLYIPSPA